MRIFYTKFSDMKFSCQRIPNFWVTIPPVISNHFFFQNWKWSGNNTQVSHFTVFILLKISVSFAISLSISDSSIPTAAARAKYGSSKLLDEQPNRFSCTLVGCKPEIFVEIQWLFYCIYFMRQRISENLNFNGCQ